MPNIESEGIEEATPEERKSEVERRAAGGTQPEEELPEPGQDVVNITEAVEAERKLAPLRSKTPEEVALENNLTVRLGYPLGSRPEGADRTPIEVGRHPYVMVIDNLSARDREHPSPVNLGRVVALIGHGLEHEGTWLLANGQTVEQTVEGYNNYAQRHNLPQIRFVVACNDPQSPQPTPGRQPVRVIGKLFNQVAQAVGERVSGSFYMLNDGRAAGYVHANGKIHNLDLLINANKVKVLGHSE